MATSGMNPPDIDDALVRQGAGPHDHPAADGDGTAQIVEPKWAVRVDRLDERNRSRSDVRMSDADELPDAVELALADVRGRHPEHVITRVTAYAPALSTLVPRTVR